MPFTVTPTEIPDLLVVEPEVHADNRGHLFEVVNGERLAERGLPRSFVQENHSRSRRGVIRGLHFQWDPPMGKVMRATVGSVFFVAVDVRKGSPALGRWFGMEASAESKRQLWAPAGFARGFCALSAWAEVQYLCTGAYNPACESGIRWDDPAVGIEWPLPRGTEPLLSEKDRTAGTLADWLAREESERFVFGTEANSGAEANSTALACRSG